MGSALPPIEVGSLTALSPNESRFIGSSSGIFFVNTVRQAFAISRVRTPGEETQPEDDTAAETYIGGVEIDHNPHNEASDSYIQNESTVQSQSRKNNVDTHLFGQYPDKEHVGKLLQVYFRVWHPLFPFLHGPTFMREVEASYTREKNVQQANDRTDQRYGRCREVTFRCIYNIAALNRTDLQLSPECSISSVTTLTTELCSLATRHDIPILQALLAGQVYLIATMSLHAASMIGGVLLRLIFHAGLHRCPSRYSQISSHDGMIRKRIFWSVYVTDRHLSQALGIPLGIQDSDIDVCIPGLAEMHHHIQVGQPTGKYSHDSHSVLTKTRRDTATVADVNFLHNRQSPVSINPITESLSRDKRPGEDALSHYVAYGRLTGRAIEMLHKSLNVRVFQYGSVLELTSDIHSFWNSLPRHLQDLPGTNQDGSVNQSLLGVFFTLIYQQLILLVNRPFLSLQPSSLEFRLSLQTCITSSRTVISTLKNLSPYYQCVPWPGTLSVTWMSGLILAFACALEMYPVDKGFPDIQSCLELLKDMSGSSQTAKHCHSALKTLLDDLSSSQYGEDLNHFTISLVSNNKRHLASDGVPFQDENRPDASKRPRPENDDVESETLQSHNGNQNTTHSRGGRNDTEPNPNSSMYTDSAPPLWDAQFAANCTGDDQAYTNDIFSQLSYENFLQYDDGFGVEFWDGNLFPGP